MATQEKYPNRWVQLVLGIVCMATVANCQYGLDAVRCPN